MKIVIANAKGPIYIKFCLKVILTFYTYACSAMSVGTLVYNTCECFCMLYRGEINNSKQDGIFTTTSIQNDGERGFTFANSNCQYR